MENLRTIIAASVVAAGLALAPPAGGTPGDTMLISRSSGGAQGNGRSEIQTNGVSAHGAVSADGRYVAFQSSADNLVPGDTNQATDVFVHDRQTGTTERVSVGTGAVQSNDFASSFDPSISADGRYVAFTSSASNWVADPDQVNDVFVHDRLTGATLIVSGSADGRADGRDAAISADGRYVAFSTQARYADSDELGTIDVYVWDRSTGTIVDWASPYTPGPGSGSPGSLYPSISGDGRYVAFESTTANLVPGDANQSRDVFVRDRQTHTTELVSVDDSGGPAEGMSEMPAVSADGRFIAFSSFASDIAAPDLNPTFDVFVRDRAAGTTERVNLRNDETQVAGQAGRPSISADGRLVAFDTSAQLVPGDSDPVQDVYVRDRVAQTTHQASVRSDGSQEGINGAEPSAISADASVVAFDTVGNLAAGDANNNHDVFVHELPSSNNPPSVDAGADAAVAEGQSFSSSGTFSDADSSSWTATVDYGDGAGAQLLALSAMSFSLAHTYDDNGVFTVTASVTDNQGATGSDTALVDVANVAPIASFSAESPITEGGSSTLELGGASDPSAADTAAGLRYSFACDGLESALASSYATAGTDASASCGFVDDGSYAVKGRIVDKDDGATTYSGSVVVVNAAPSVGAITASADPIAVGTSVSASVQFTDAGTLDTHTALFGWGDGTSSPGAVAEANGSGSTSGSHLYTVPGVYTLTLTVIDDDGGSAQSSYSFVVVYDPNGPSVRGRGTILSPTGAYVADASLTGEAAFGFQSGYRRGSTVPSGHTRFQFQIADFMFVSRDYDWLVVAGARAQFKGTGEVNGTGAYGFLLTAVDGDASGGGGVDKFRIKIWDKATGDVVYDNKVGAGDDADPQAIAEGSIVIR